MCGMNPHGNLHTLPAGMITTRRAVNIASNNVRLFLFPSLSLSLSLVDKIKLAD